MFRTSLLIITFFVLFASCKEQGPAKDNSLQQYFAIQDSGVQTGGVKLVEIQTPKGKFHVWTKRIGHNPRIKVLLLHGGRGVTHEAF